MKRSLTQKIPVLALDSGVDADRNVNFNTARKD